MSKLIFDNTARLQWLSKVMDYAKIHSSNPDDPANLCFPGIKIADLKPLHIVSAACLIESLSKIKRDISLDKTEVGNYMFEKLKFREYWAEGQDYTCSEDENILNLWRLQPNQKDVYPREVTKYLKRFAKSKDLSAISMSITEAFYNVCDHANAQGNAFSFISFDPEKLILDIAVCDFGIGIGNSVRTIYPSMTDEEALKNAIQPTFTVKSQEHNSGMGLDVIRGSSTSDKSMVIISNTAFLAAKTDTVRSCPMDFNFQGTLVNYQINLNHYDDSEECDFLDFNL